MTDESSTWHGGHQLQDRIDLLLRKCYSCRELDDYDNWYDNIGNLKAEVSCFMDEDKRTRLSSILLKARGYIQIPRDKRSGDLGRKIWPLIDLLDEAQMVLRQVIRDFKLDVPTQGAAGSGFVKEFEDG